MNKYLKLAHRLCKKSEAKHHKMCAVTVRGNSIKSIGLNRLYDHAEKRALRPHMNYVGADIYIARGNGKTSRPCAECRELIIRAGIRRAIYISVDGIEIVEPFKK